MFVSADGHAVRYLVQTDLDPFGTQAMDQVAQIMDAARSAQPNTELADATISIAGLPAVNADVRDYYNHDMRFILTMTILVVLLILIVLLRAVVAPLYLIASVAISFLSALGIGVVVFQFILGQTPRVERAGDRVHRSGRGRGRLQPAVDLADPRRGVPRDAHGGDPDCGRHRWRDHLRRNHLRRVHVRPDLRQHRGDGAGRVHHRRRTCCSTPSWCAR